MLRTSTMLLAACVLPGSCSRQALTESRRRAPGLTKSGQRPRQLVGLPDMTSARERFVPGGSKLVTRALARSPQRRARPAVTVLTALPLLAALVPARAASVVPLSQGLAFTSTQHMGLISSVGSVPIADTEAVYSVTGVQADKVSYAFYLSSPQDASARKILAKTKNRFERDVNRTDLQSAARLIITFSSDDPRLFPGQTFAGTSAAVLQA